MRKISYIFTAILAIVASTGAWASTPTAKEAQEGTSHTVYTNAPIEGEASEGIAGVTYVNRVANRAGAAAQAAENHAAHASKSAYDAATAASNAQTSANAAATAANSITNGNGITIDTSEAGKKKITVNPKANAGISVDANGVAVKAGKGIDVSDGNVNVTPGVGIKINNDAVAVNTGAGLKTETGGAVTINEGVGLKLEGNVLVPNLTGSNSVTITEGTGDDADKLVISANTPAANTAGVVEMPTYTEVQQLINPGATPQPAYLGEGKLDRKYGLSVETYMNAEAQQDLDLQTTFTTLLDKEVSLPTDTNDSTIKNVGANVRPVYVNNGTAAAVESVAIPVGSENFANTITSANVAKIWIQ